MKKLSFGCSQKPQVFGVPNSIEVSGLRVF